MKPLGLSAGNGIVVIERPMWGGTWVERKKFEKEKEKEKGEDKKGNRCKVYFWCLKIKFC